MSAPISQGPEANVVPPSSETGAAPCSSNMGDERSDSTMSPLPDETVSEDVPRQLAGEGSATSAVPSPDPVPVGPSIRRAVSLKDLGS
jgi:hypothetical protein